MNPVYETDDKSIYILPDAGVLISPNLNSKATSTHKSSFTIREGNKYTEKDFSVIVNISPKLAPTEYTLKEMDSQDHIINTFAITPDNIPSQIIKMEDTAYIIMESIDDGKVLERDIIGDERFMTVYFSNDVNIVYATNIELVPGTNN